MIRSVLRPPFLALVGPASSGKSTLGEIVARRLDRPFVDLDAVAADYYAEVGWSIERLVDRIAVVGRVAAEREWEPARTHAVGRAIESSPDAVLALGAGHTTYVDPEQRERAASSLRRVPHRVLLVPSLDRRTALGELRHRSLADKGTDWIAGGHDFLAEWYDDPGAREIATGVLVTAGQTPRKSAERVVALVGGAHP